MKRLLKKKISFFGKEVSVFVVVLLAIGLVSAALVPYLSNMISGMVTANSPMEQRIALGLIGLTNEGDIILETLVPITLMGVEKF